MCILAKTTPPRALLSTKPTHTRVCASFGEPFACTHKHAYTREPDADTHEHAYTHEHPCAVCRNISAAPELLLGCQLDLELL